ncbi:patatin-like phospholipase family protein [Streptomyces sp. NPDC021093]|uniref:patatin-like phospholipase family protein n=1 Tax=Streptomyces sp. NPDC021093 TaxID=3365112 RepID=UPI0037AB39BE
MTDTPATTGRPDATAAASGSPRVAFVLGGGGPLGGYQAGMVRALFERGIVPDFVIGTSIGSVQGAMIAKNPTLSVCEEMESFWRDFVTSRAMRLNARSILNALSMRSAINSNEVVRRLLSEYLGAATRIEDLAVPYECTAASIERATVRYFDSGPLVPCVMASAAIPGLWPSIRIGDEHYVDGGVAESVPLTRAIAHGATTVYVLRMRQKELQLRPARFPWQLGPMVLELSRRHHLHHALNSRPDGVAVHILPSGEDLMEPPENGAWTTRREELATIHRRVEGGHRAAARFLDEQENRRPAAPRRSTPAVSPVRRPLTPFVAAKLRRHFDVYDTDADGVVSGTDFRRAAQRVAGAFGHAEGSARAAALEREFTTYWESLAAAAEGAAGAARKGVDADAVTLEREPFGKALAGLASSSAAYSTHLLPVVAAILAVADHDHDGFLNPAETGRLLCALGVAESESARVARRLDTNGDGVTSLDELVEAFHDYFTSSEPGCVGNSLFGTGPGSE